jgi:type I restriction enzyme S subunit
VPASAKRFALQRSVAVITPAGVLPKYLMYQFQSPFLQRHFEKNARGTAQKGVYLKTLGQTPILVAPLGQQELIIAEIDKQFSRLDEAIANLKRVKANLKRYKASVLKAAVEGKLTEDWRKQHPYVEPASKLLERILAERRAKWNGRGKYKEPTPPGTNDLPSLPKGWTWARLEQIGETFGGLTKNPKRGKLTKKLPYLRVANVYANKLRLDEIEHIGVQVSELGKLLLRKGDLLVVEGNGSRSQIGRLAIWDGSIDPCVHQNHLIKVRLVVGSMNKWILFWLLSPGGRHFIEEVSSSTSGLYTLSVNKVGDLPIIVLPHGEQEQIIAEVERRLSVIEELEAAVQANLTRADRLRQSILSNVFAGKLVCANTNQSGERSADIQMAKSLE